MADRLTLTRALESGGMDSQAAERVATEIYDAIQGNVATKTDLREMEQRLDLRFEQLDRRIDAMVTRLGGITVIATGILIAIKYFAETLRQ